MNPESETRSLISQSEFLIIMGPQHPQRLHTAETSFLLPSGKIGLSVVQCKVIASHVYEMLYVRGLGSGTSNACPSCFLEGADCHYLGYCIHKNMVKSHIESYSEAGILILQAISRGRDGNKSYSAHCGTNHHMEKWGLSVHVCLHVSY